MFAQESVMEIQKEKKAIKNLKAFYMEDWNLTEEERDDLDNLVSRIVAVVKTEAQAVLEGFVLVPKDKISHFYQDNDEPENFCNSSNDWDCLGDGIDKDQIMIVNKHTQANISTEKFYGAWKLIETSYGTRWKFELFKSESEAKQAMIEAQEQSHE